VEKRRHLLLRLASVLVSSAAAAITSGFLAAYIGSFLPDHMGAIAFESGLVIGAIVGACAAWRYGPEWVWYFFPT